MRLGSGERLTMPVYHFVIHAYGSYLPDHDLGSHHPTRGYRRPNHDELADAYHRRQREPTVMFGRDHQRLLIEAMQRAANFQGYQLFAVACDSAHLHVVAAWPDDARSPERVRAEIKSSLTRRLNAALGRRSWLSARGACGRVWDWQQLSYLLTTYLPKHGGEQWYWRDTHGTRRERPG